MSAAAHSGPQGRVEQMHVSARRRRAGVAQCVADHDEALTGGCQECIGPTGSTVAGETNAAAGAAVAVGTLTKPSWTNRSARRQRRHTAARHLLPTALVLAWCCFVIIGNPRRQRPIGPGPNERNAVRPQAVIRTPLFTPRHRAEVLGEQVQKRDQSAHSIRRRATNSASCALFPHPLLDRFVLQHDIGQQLALSR
jgi:hypothetical protein